MVCAIIDIIDTSRGGDGGGSCNSCNSSCSMGATFVVRPNHFGLVHAINVDTLVYLSTFIDLLSHTYKYT